MVRVLPEEGDKEKDKRVDSVCAGKTECRAWTWQEGSKDSMVRMHRVIHFYDRDPFILGEQGL